MAVIDEIKKLLGTSSLVFGAKETMKALRSSSVQKVYLATNVQEDLRSDIEHAALVDGVEIVKLDIANDELGVACKKPFSIGVIGLKKQ